MHTTKYKGFNIHSNFGRNPERFYPQNNGDAVFNNKGYPTLNHAKGAITNYLKTKVAAAIAATADTPVSERMEAIRIAVRGTVSKPEHATQSRNKREGRFYGKGSGKIDRCRDVSRPLSARNCIAYPANRKQRKHAKMQGYRDSAAQ